MSSTFLQIGYHSYTCYSQYEDHVVGDGSNFADAYFEIGYIRTYGEDGSLVDTSGSKPTTNNNTSGAGGVGFMFASAVLGLFGLLL